MRTLRFNWLICLYLFMSLIRIASFLIVKNSCVREELTDLPFFLQTQLQQITVPFWWVRTRAPYLSLLPFCDSNNTDSFLTIQFWTKPMKKLVRNYQKIAGKKRSNKTKLSDIKYFLTIYFPTKTTKKCANFVHVLDLFQPKMSCSFSFSGM